MSEATDVCEHLASDYVVTPTTPDGCEECLQMGSRWVHLRMCLECGHVGCCDASPNRHATAHFHETNHPAVTSLEPGEEWGYCYSDDIFVEQISRAGDAERDPVDEASKESFPSSDPPAW